MTLHDLLALPELLPLLLLAPLLWLLLAAMDRARQAAMRRTLGPRQDALTERLSLRRRRRRRALSATALGMALLAVLQPVWGESIQRVEQRGIDVLLCLDVSRSMLARDLEPDRLRAAQAQIAQLVERARGDRIGLVAFAGTALLRVPLTRDGASLVQMAALTDPLTVERGGTDLGAALDEALRALGEGAGRHEAIVLLTDGEDHEQRGLRTAERCRARGVTVHCIGFGSPLGGRIPVAGAGGETFLRDDSGAEVISTMDPVSLGRIAEVTGGEFVDASTRPAALVEVYQRRVLPMAQKAFAADARRLRENRFQWPLLLAVLLWALELGITDRRRLA